jgi:hypothetical protein
MKEQNNHKNNCNQILFVNLNSYYYIRKNKEFNEIILKIENNVGQQYVNGTSSKEEDIKAKL